jgi:hypothetical protein
MAGGFRNAPKRRRGEAARRPGKRSPPQWDDLATPPGIRAVTARADAREASGFPPRKERKREFPRPNEEPCS